MTSKFISGKVAVDDGTLLTDRAIIQSICKGQRHSEAYTDARGNFSFEFGRQRQEYADAESTSMGSVQTITPQGVRSNSDRFSSDCQLQAVLPGFTSQVVELSRYPDEQVIDIGTIGVHRMQGVEGYTISASTAAAPPEARKQFQKAQEDEVKGKLENAEKKLEKAVSLYPGFAVAWVELGRLQAQFKKFDAARQSFARAISIDPRLTTAYQYQARIAFQQHSWEELVNLTNQLVKMNAVGFPEGWFYNAVGNFYLNRLEVAEQSARQGLKADVQHRVPKLDYLLAVLLMKKRDFSGAAEHFRAYLAHPANPTEAQQVQAQLADAERLSKSPLGQQTQPQ
jgi:tetratricopeptide (TPR) repeat protein